MQGSLFVGGLLIVIRIFTKLQLPTFSGSEAEEQTAQLTGRIPGFLIEWRQQQQAYPHLCSDGKYSR